MSTLFGVGVGPGDPELMTLKAQRVIRSAPVVAYFSANGRASHARQIAEGLLEPHQAELHLVYPVTTETLPQGVHYEEVFSEFYDAVAEQLAEVLEDGRDVAVLCEGDPFLHGSFMYLHGRLARRFATEVVPGVPAMLASSAQLGRPLVCQDEILRIVPGTLEEDQMASELAGADAVVVMKVGRHLEKIRRALTNAGLADRAWYVERVTMKGQRVLPLAEARAEEAPYFSMVVVPSKSAPTR